MTAAFNLAIAQPPESRAGTVIGWIFIAVVLLILAASAGAGIRTGWQWIAGRHGRRLVAGAERYLRRIPCTRCELGDAGLPCACPRRCTSAACLADTARETR